MIDTCPQAPTIVSHRANAYCRDGWHATVLSIREANPEPDYFNGFFLGAEVQFEPAPEARPLSDFWGLDEWETEGEWHPFLVRFRQEIR